MSYNDTKSTMRLDTTAAGGETFTMDEKPTYVLTIEELSAYLKIPKSTLYKLVREGKVPCHLSACGSPAQAGKIGRHWRFRKEAIDRWLEDLPAASGAAQAGTHGDTTNRQDSRFGRTEGAPEGRGPGKARVKDGGNE